MTGNKSWQLGSPDTFLYRVYDSLRRQLNQTLVRYLIKVTALNQNSKILEAGSGPAFGSSLFGQEIRTRLSVALDLDEEALREARKRDPKLPMLVGDLHALPFGDEVFDLVWNSSTLEHFDNPATVLKQMKQITRRGGYIFVGVPYLYGPLGFQRWIARTRVGIWLGTVFNKKQLYPLLSSDGFRIVKIRTYFFHFFIGILAQKI